jgi:L-serine dehydratase
MMPSIFNDVIGPVMRGPSSSHTAASHRIGSIIRQISKSAIRSSLIEFDRNGSLATTYEGQGSAMGLISGFLGISILDPDLLKYNDLARDQNMDIRFQITDFENTHPNTYKILIENNVGEKFSFIAVSTGGGMFGITRINKFEISIKGDYYETLICCCSDNFAEIQDLFSSLENNTGHSEIGLSPDNNNRYLIDIKSVKPVPEMSDGLLNGYECIEWVRQIEPVMPILSGADEELPFSSIAEMLKLAEQTGIDLAELATKFETARAGIDSQKVHRLMRDIVLRIKTSLHAGLKGSIYNDRILGHQSHLILEAEKGKRIFPTPQNTIIAYVTALMETKSSMGIIVAAPTAGSSGVIGGAVFGVAAGYPEDIDSIVKAFLAAGLIGVFIADRYTFAAEEGGCQVECGAASCMAAAALVQFMGGTARQAVNAASMALQNMLGLICDPVANRVEVPCLGKNILGATNAISSANMSIAGFDPVIPLDEVIDAMRSVGESLPSSLCCTGLSGLSATPTALKLQEKLRKTNQRKKHHNNKENK